MRITFVLLGLGIVAAIAPAVSAIPQDVPVCYYQTKTGQIINLSSWCGYPTVDHWQERLANYNGNNGNNPTRGGTFQPAASNGKKIGNCNSPDDIAADGSRCGGRAKGQHP